MIIQQELPDLLSHLSPADTAQPVSPAALLHLLMHVHAQAQLGFLNIYQSIPQLPDDGTAMLQYWCWMRNPTPAGYLSSELLNGGK